MRGTGTQANPYIFDNVNDLQDMSLDAYHYQAYYEMDHDIDATVTAGWNGGAGFDPIGHYVIGPNVNFTGQFDGKGYSIINLFINRIAPTVHHEHVGLFGSANNSIIKNVSLVNVSITGDGLAAPLLAYGDDDGVEISNCHASGIVTTNNLIPTSAAGLIGSVYIDGLILPGNITNCSSSCIVSASHNAGGLIADAQTVGGPVAGKISHCSSSGKVNFGRDAGGLISYIEIGRVEYCYSTSNITRTSAPGGPGNDYVGGLCGLIVNTGIKRSYATGNINSLIDPGINEYAGGIIGAAEGAADIDDCYARGNVYTVAAAGLAGGFIGSIAALIAVTIEDCYSTGRVIASTIGGFIASNGGPNIPQDCFWDTEASGTLISDGGTGHITSWMKYRSNFIDAGWNFACLWFMDRSINNGYPAFIGLGSSYKGWPTLGLSALKPEVQTMPATKISENRATLNGILIADGGRACLIYFEWGTTTLYGNTTPKVGRQAGDSFGLEITGLHEGEAYHFRAVAAHSPPVYGADMVFGTLSPYGPVTLIEDTKIEQWLGVT